MYNENDTLQIRNLRQYGQHGWMWEVIENGDSVTWHTNRAGEGLFILAPNGCDSYQQAGAIQFSGRAHKETVRKRIKRWFNR